MSNINRQKFKKLEKVINEIYILNKLRDFYKYFLQDVINKNKELCKQAGVPLNLPKKAKKSDFVYIMTFFFYDKNLFQVLMAELPAHITKMLEDAIWGESFDRDYVLNAYKDDLIIGGGHFVSQAYMEVKPVYYLFQDDAQYIGWNRYRHDSTYFHFLYIDPSLAVFLREFLVPTSAYNLQPIVEVETKNRFNVSELIFQELPIVNAYINQGRLKLTKKGKITEAALKKMLKFCNLKEFFESTSHKTYVTYRSRFLADIALYLNEEAPKNVTGDVMHSLQHLTKSFTEYMVAIEKMLFHTKGWDYIDTQSKPYASFRSLLNELPAKEWIEIDALHKYVQLKGLDFSALYNSWDLRSIQVTLVKKSPYEHKVTLYLHKTNYYKVFTIPFLLNAIALFASLGILEVAYDDAAWEDLLMTHEKFLTPGIDFKYVRLTNLGAYLLGKTKDYAPPALKEDKVILDEENLLFLYQGDNLALLGMIESVSNKVSTNLYQVSFETVLGNCNNSKEVEAQISVFSQLLSKNPPKIWQEFFESLQQKSYQLINQNEEYLIYQLPNNQELLRLVATDDFLRKYIIKAEFHNVLIPHKHKAKIKKYLKKSGFLIEFD